MGRPESDEKTEASQKTKEPKFHAKLERRQSSKWIRACPRCFSIRLRPLVSIAGIISPEEWECLDCDFVGISIEVHPDDLMKLHRERKPQAPSKIENYNMNKKSRRELS